MKLRNKKTGEIIDIKDVFTESDNFPNHYIIRNGWEDYEEPKGIKEIFFTGATVNIAMSCQEEAKKAVEKLKAWKRLKDKGFRFDGISNYKISFEFEERVMKKGEVFAPQEDLDLLFGGEE